MNISQERIESYKKMHKKETGEDISDEEAREQSERLVGFFQLLLEIDTRNKSKKSNFSDPPKSSKS